MSMETDQDTLYHLGYDCETWFNKLEQTCNLRNVQAATAILCRDFQQRFAIWAAYLGVFARKSQCLDRRIHNHPDLKDLATRLMSILCRALQQCVTQMSTSGVEGNSIPQLSNSNPSQPLAESLRMIDETLGRLTRLGVTIRQSSNQITTERVNRFIAGRNLDSFSLLCAAAVQVLYPAAKESLKDRLTKSMTNRYTRILLVKSRIEKLGTRREPETELILTPQPIDERPAPEPSVISPAPTMRVSMLKRLPRPADAHSISDLTSINIQAIKARLRPPDEPSVRSHRTMSLRYKQKPYPQPPDATEGISIFACEWCSEPLDRSKLSKADWSRHVDRDLQPYICLSEACQEAHPVYSSFDDWTRHMNLHDRRWFQRVHLKPTWICTICESTTDTYSGPQTLYSHLTQCHEDDFTTTELQAISRQSSMDRSRPWNSCLLCGFEVEENRDDKAVSRKRRKLTIEQKTQSAGSFSKIRGSSSPLEGEVSGDSSDSDSSLSELPARTRVAERSQIISRHIAGHLQMLVSLTIRLTALQNESNYSIDDVNSASVDIDVGNNTSSDGDLGRPSELSASMDNAEMPIKGLDYLDDPMEVDDVTLEEDIPIPDSDINLADIPRQSDKFANEKDLFLEGLVSSGAYQSWKREQKREEKESRFPGTEYEGYSGDKGKGDMAIESRPKATDSLFAELASLSDSASDDEGKGVIPTAADIEVLLRADANYSDVKKAMLETTRAIIAEVLADPNATNVNSSRTPFEDLTGLIRLLGTQGKYAELVNVLSLLWSRREEQKKSHRWSPTMVFRIGTLLIHAQQENQDTCGAISTAEFLYYNARRGFGSLDARTLALSKLLSSLYLSENRDSSAMSAMRLHEKILVKIASTGEENKNNCHNLLNECKLHLEIVRGILARWEITMLRDLEDRQVLYRRLESIFELGLPSYDQWLASQPAQNTGRYTRNTDWDISHKV
ncbi:hypothetical protein B0I35DRAFT_184255 [Stachybotrys elegans]|uniref:C2H2-type domain-containing protein n=1 Tax=Stachybotrys elegans TaxID=80388 RepID=A0A8K0SYU1_9HYPO|nr:hypothetical protein B0I35DRAFT_184255 [Stachybotrys elegans]